MDVIAAIDAARERWNVLEHPFYVRWERGELTRDELARYAGEYRHAVVALARSARTAGVHAEEEASHIALCDDFASDLRDEAARSRRALRLFGGLAGDGLLRAAFRARPRARGGGSVAARGLGRRA